MVLSVRKSCTNNLSSLINLIDDTLIGYRNNIYIGSLINILLIIFIQNKFNKKYLLNLVYYLFNYQTLNFVYASKYYIFNEQDGHYKAFNQKFHLTTQFVTFHSVLTVDVFNDFFFAYR